MKHWEIHDNLWYVDELLICLIFNINEQFKTWIQYLTLHLLNLRLKPNPVQHLLSFVKDVIFFGLIFGSLDLTLTFSDTSREPRQGEEHGKGYFFDSRQNMEADIKAGKFLEYGEFNGNLYGTKLDSIHYTVQQGKMCVLDVNPTVS